jgi:hypothetical protein
MGLSKNMFRQFEIVDKIAHNVFRLGDAAEIVVQMFSFVPMFSRRTELQFVLQPPYCQTDVCGSLFHLVLMNSIFCL